MSSNEREKEPQQVRENTQDPARPSSSEVDQDANLDNEMTFSPAVSRFGSATSDVRASIGRNLAVHNGNEGGNARSRGSTSTGSWTPSIPWNASTSSVTRHRGMDALNSTGIRTPTITTTTRSHHTGSHLHTSNRTPSSGLHHGSRMRTPGSGMRSTTASTSGTPGNRTPTPPIAGTRTPGIITPRRYTTASSTSVGGLSSHSRRSLGSGYTTPPLHRFGGGTRTPGSEISTPGGGIGSGVSGSPLSETGSAYGFLPLRGVETGSVSASSVTSGTSVDTVGMAINVHKAATDGDLEGVVAWLDRGGHPDAKSRGQRSTPLSRASSKGHVKVVEVLLEAGASIDNVGRGGMTPLHEAAGSGQSIVCQLLLRAGANVMARDYYQRCPLHYSGSSVEVASLLLDFGADPAVKDKNGKMAEDIAVKSDAKLVMKQARIAARNEGASNNATRVIMSLRRDLANKEEELKRVHAEEDEEASERDNLIKELNQLRQELAEAREKKDSAHAAREELALKMASIEREHEQIMEAREEEVELELRDVARRNRKKAGKLVTRVESKVATRILELESRRDFAENLLRVKVKALETTAIEDKRRIKAIQGQLKAMHQAIQRRRSMHPSLGIPLMCAPGESLPIRRRREAGQQGPDLSSTIGRNRRARSQSQDRGGMDGGEAEKRDGRDEDRREEEKNVGLELELGQDHPKGVKGVVDDIEEKRPLLKPQEQSQDLSQERTSIVEKKSDKSDNDQEQRYKEEIVQGPSDEDQSDHSEGLHPRTPQPLGIHGRSPDMWPPSPADVAVALPSQLGTPLHVIASREQHLPGSHNHRNCHLQSNPNPKVVPMRDEEEADEENEKKLFSDVMSELLAKAKAAALENEAAALRLTVTALRADLWSTRTEAAEARASAVEAQAGAVAIFVGAFAEARMPLGSGVGGAAEVELKEAREALAVERKALAKIQELRSKVEKTLQAARSHHQSPNRTESYLKGPEEGEDLSEVGNAGRMTHKDSLKGGAGGNHRGAVGESIHSGTGQEEWRNAEGRGEGGAKERVVEDEYRLSGLLEEEQETRRSVDRLVGDLEAALSATLNQGQDGLPQSLREYVGYLHPVTTSGPNQGQGGSDPTSPVTVKRVGGGNSSPSSPRLTRKTLVQAGRGKQGGEGEEKEESGDRDPGGAQKRAPFDRAVGMGIGMGMGGSKGEDMVVASVAGEEGDAMREEKETKERGGEEGRSSLSAPDLESDLLGELGSTSEPRDTAMESGPDLQDTLQLDNQAPSGNKEISSALSELVGHDNLGTKWTESTMGSSGPYRSLTRQLETALGRLGKLEAENDFLKKTIYLWEREMEAIESEEPQEESVVEGGSVPFLYWDIM